MQQQTSPTPSSSSPQLSNSPSSTSKIPAIRRRRGRHRRQPPPSPTPSSTSQQHSSSHNNITYENQLNSSYSSPINSTSSAPPIFLSAVVPLPVFRGLPDECPVAHLTLFNRLFPSPAPLPLVSRNFAVTLSDDAALWYEIAVEPRAMSWDETKSAFLRAFRAPQFAETARAELVSLRQGDVESVNSYHLRMQWILKRWAGHGMNESLVRGLFVDGLRDEFRDWVAMRKPETVGEAVGAAMDCEEGRRGGGTLCGFCEGRHGERECEARRRMKEEWMKRSRVKEEEKIERVGSIGSKCQCWKHQCWKKYERSGSAATVKNGDAGEVAAAAEVGGISKVERIGGMMMMAVGGFFSNLLVLCFGYL